MGEKKREEKAWVRRKSEKIGEETDKPKRNFLLRSLLQYNVENEILMHPWH